MALHALWDAGLFTGQINDEVYVPALAFLLVNLTIAAVLVVRRRRMGLDPATVTRPSAQGT